MGDELEARRPWRAALGFTLAALIAAAPLTALVYFSTETAGDERVLTTAITYVALFLLHLLLVLFFGWPFHAWARQQKWKRYTTYLGAGAVLALFAAILIYALYGARMEDAEDEVFTAGYATGVFIGACLVTMIPMFLMSTTFWLVRRPDRDGRRVAPIFE